MKPKGAQIKLTFNFVYPYYFNIMNKIKLLLSSLVVITSLVFAAEMKEAKQTAVGTIDQYDAHGKIVYRFVPKDKKSRLIKFIPARIGHRKGLPKEMEKFFAEALKEKKEVEIACEFKDKGAGKTSFATKLVSYKLVEAK